MRKKIIIVFLIFFIISTIAFAYTINGGVSYTVETARTIAFEGVRKKIDMSVYEKYIHDADYEKNKNAINKGKTKFRNRKLIYFSNGTYAIKYLKDIQTGYFYDKFGNLEYIAIRKQGYYPIKSVKYNIDGTLDSIILSTSKSEQYIFNKDGQMIAHWIGNNGYDEKGELFGTRK